MLLACSLRVPCIFLPCSWMRLHFFFFFFFFDPAPATSPVIKGGWVGGREERRGIEGGREVGRGRLGEGVREGWRRREGEGGREKDRQGWMEGERETEGEEKREDRERDAEREREREREKERERAREREKERERGEKGKYPIYLTGDRKRGDTHMQTHTNACTYARMHAP